jgi:hypothetical protein
MKVKLIIFLLLLSCIFLNQGHSTNFEEDDLEEIGVRKKRKIGKVEEVIVEPQKKVKLTSKKKVPEMIEEATVELKAGKGTKKSGGGLGGHYWNIFYNEKRAGKVFINLINEEPLGQHPSLQIFLNKASQGKHIGRVAYRQACELSQYDVIYAYMSKKNLPSIKAARAAGFVQILAETTKQVIMQWTRKKK